MPRDRRKPKAKQKMEVSARQTPVSNKVTAEPNALSFSKRLIFYSTLIAIPVLFFLLLETTLRIFNYGYDYEEWVGVARGKYVLNPDIARKYFQITRSVPYSNQDLFDRVKKPNAYRIFILGESSGAGYPYLPIGSFSRYLQQRLSLEFPDSKIEVVNLSMTAINTYTLRDLFPGVLEQKPDLVLVYTGHNEYYGVLGVGSMESLGSQRSIVNFVIYLEQFRTFQLLKNLLKRAAELLTSQKNEPTGTLMARMAQNHYIPLGSDLYQKGIEQFEENLRDILEMANKAKVPVILSTLACNLKDQPPFVSAAANGFPPANDVYLKAKESLGTGDWKRADSLFRLAKDLDALRFRAPTEINNSILKLGGEFNYPVLDVDSAFNEASPGHVVGDNLMTDHLHPTLQGYQLIGRLFCQEMKKQDLLPKSTPASLTDGQQDSMAVANFPFTKLDSVIAEYRIKLLKNDWPYIGRNKKIPEGQLLKPKDFIDSLAFQVVMDNADWELVHRKAAQWYLSQGKFDGFLKTMNVLISEYPVVVEYYDYAANALLQIKDYDKAYQYLLQRDAMEPSAYSAKWLGIIDLSKKKTDSAKRYLLVSSKMKNDDPQVLYNLAGCYVFENDYKSALDTLKHCLALQPDYAEALALQTQLLRAMAKQ